MLLLSLPCGPITTAWARVRVGRMAAHCMQGDRPPLGLGQDLMHRLQCVSIPKPPHRAPNRPAGWRTSARHCGPW